ncbi:MAG: LysM peptidoglycan-binding domain-containing protein [Candidatus Promineifilaceae bacterium]|nr:LysM peptidoglycan-binding domain-containing protein [Candidatus Promineifilaceae bacterium]
MSYRLIWLILIVAAMLTLAACVRPVPREEPSQPSEQDINVTQPVIQAPTPVTTPISTTVISPTVEIAQPTIAIEPTAELPTETIHTVQAGDTLFQIASQYGVTIDVITSVNNIPNINQLEVGQQLIIPGPGYVLPTATAEIVAEPTTSSDQQPPDTAQDGTHVVQPGENLYRIGLQYGCSVEQMAAHNGIVNPAAISVGQVLNIPDCN